MTKCWKVEPAERPAFENIYTSLQNMLNDNEVNTLILATVFQFALSNNIVIEKEMCGMFSFDNQIK